MRNKKFRPFCIALITVALFTACNSNKNSGNSIDTFSNEDKDQQNKERMMPDTTSDLLDYDSTKTKTGR